MRGSKHWVPWNIPLESDPFPRHHSLQTLSSAWPYISGFLCFILLGQALTLTFLICPDLQPSSLPGVDTDLFSKGL